MANNYEHLDHHDVISCQTEQSCSLLGVKSTTFKVNELTKNLLVKVGAGANTEPIKWHSEGVNAEVLMANKGWRKGKVRLSIEFCPDEPEENKPEIKEPESPLDELRKSLQN